MKTLLISLCLTIAVIRASALRMELNYEWQNYKGAHGRFYSSAYEDTLRRDIWEENYDFIENHNMEADRGNSSYWLKMNQLSDMTTEEVIEMYTGFNMTDFKEDLPSHVFTSSRNVSLPESIDWVEKKKVTRVKNQGGCGSCWAFSATGTLEGIHALKTGKLVSLSEQHLMDCDEDNHECKGGLPIKAYKYILKNNGIEIEESYPYEMKRDTCRFNETNVGANLTAWKVIPKGDEQSLKEAVANVGPISVGIDSRSKHFMYYSHGVYNKGDCNSEMSKLNHAALVVGYGTTEDGEDYWIVKNSWGPNWGDKGYIRMARNKDNMCGIATFATYPVV